MITKQELINNDVRRYMKEHEEIIYMAECIKNEHVKLFKKRTGLEINSIYIDSKHRKYTITAIEASVPGNINVYGVTRKANKKFKKIEELCGLTMS